MEASLDAAQAYLQSGQTENAEAILVRLVERAPHESRGHELLGQAFSARAADAARAGDDDRAEALRQAALDHYLQACDLRPEEAGLAHAAGVVALMAGDRPVALEQFERAAALDPSSPQYPLFAAQVLLQSDRPAEARAHLMRGLAIDDRIPHLHASLAMLAAEEGDYDEARAHAAEATRLAPHDPSMRITEARVLRRGGDADQALERLLALPAAQRAEVSTTEEIARSAAACDRVDLAVEAWAACYVATSDPRAAAEAGLLVLDLGRRDEARDWLARARLGRRDDVAVRTLGRRLQE